MATRFYLPDYTIYPSPIAPAYSAGWDDATFPSRARLVTTKTSDAPFTFGFGTAGTNILFLQYISNTLAPQTIAGTIKGVLRTSETTAADDRCAQLRAYVVDGPGLVVRGVLYDLDNSALTSEADVTLTSRLHPRGSPKTVSSVVTKENDRIIIELGARNFSANANQYNMEFRANATTDLAENETDTSASNSWIEFSQTLLFNERQPVGARAM